MTRISYLFETWSFTMWGFQWLCWCLWFVDSTSAMETKSVRVRLGPFQDAKEGKVLVNNSMNIFETKTRSRSLCALNCIVHPHCRAFIFCVTRSCKLLSQDVFSTEQFEDILKNGEKCGYFGMNKNELPNCKEGVRKVSIAVDSPPGRCAINSKRVDRVWTDWKRQRVIDNSVDLKESEVRDIIIDSAHGGVGESESERIVFWIRLIYELLTWDEAKMNCENLGGNLFDDLNGTTAQLDMIIQNIAVQNQLYFLGITTTSHTSNVYYKMDGTVLDNSLLLWSWENEPNQGPLETVLVLCPSVEFWPLYIHDAPDQNTYYSICDM